MVAWGCCAPCVPLPWALLTAAPSANTHAGTIILTAAEHESMLYIGRVILGFGVGFAIQVQLISERPIKMLLGRHLSFHVIDQLLAGRGVLTSCYSPCCSARPVSFTHLPSSLRVPAALCCVLRTCRFCIVHWHVCRCLRAVLLAGAEEVVFLVQCTTRESRIRWPYECDACWLVLSQS
jgi:hypothetical protein